MNALAYLAALSAPSFYALSNLIDGDLSSKAVKKIGNLVFYSICFNAVFLPLLWLADAPGTLPLRLLPWCALIALIEVLYPFFYYRALQNVDTSVVASLFALGKIFLPLMAFVFVGERLAFFQYAGSALILFGSVALTTNGTRFRFGPAFFYMLTCSFVLSGEAVIYKYLFERITWSTGFFWSTLLSLGLASSLLLFPVVRRRVDPPRRVGGHAIRLFALEEFFSFVGSTLMSYSIAFIPVTLAKTLEEIQPLFVLFFALTLGRAFPGVFHERVDRKTVLKKLVLFGVMLSGVWLILTAEPSF